MNALWQDYKLVCYSHARICFWCSWSMPSLWLDVSSWLTLAGGYLCTFGAKWISTSFFHFFHINVVALLYSCLAHFSQLSEYKCTPKSLQLYSCLSMQFLGLNWWLDFCRCCTSLLIDYCQDEGAHKYIIIDVGKTFREQVLRWFVCHKIPCVDSVSSWLCSCSLQLIWYGLLDDRTANYHITALVKICQWCVCINIFNLFMTDSSYSWARRCDLGSWWCSGCTAI
jgi:hypothetical protein